MSEFFDINKGVIVDTSSIPSDNRSQYKHESVLRALAMSPLSKNSAYNGIINDIFMNWTTNNDDIDDAQLIDEITEELLNNTDLNETDLFGNSYADIVPPTNLINPINNQNNNPNQNNVSPSFISKATEFEGDYSTFNPELITVPETITFNMPIVNDEGSVVWEGEQLSITEGNPAYEYLKMLDIIEDYNHPLYLDTVTMPKAPNSYTRKGKIIQVQNPVTGNVETRIYGTNGHSYSVMMDENDPMSGFDVFTTHTSMGTPYADNLADLTAKDKKGLYSHLITTSASMNYVKPIIEGIVAGPYMGAWGAFEQIDKAIGHQQNPVEGSGLQDHLYGGYFGGGGWLNTLTGLGESEQDVMNRTLMPGEQFRYMISNPEVYNMLYGNYPTVQMYDDKYDEKSPYYIDPMKDKYPIPEYLQDK